MEIKHIPCDKLAYIGDAVFELYIRKKVLLEVPGKANTLHRAAVHYVRAKFQANAAVNIQDSLTEEELNILRRGRNANQGAIAKHASPQEYRWATALETLIGYLYLSEQEQRLEEILSLVIEEGEKDYE